MNKSNKLLPFFLLTLFVSLLGTMCLATLCYIFGDVPVYLTCVAITAIGGLIVFGINITKSLKKW